MDPLFIVVPLLFLLMGVEAVVLARRGGRRHRLNDSMSAISCAILDQLGILMIGGSYLALYAQLQNRYGLVHIAPNSPFAWIACVIAHEATFYVYHRASHRVNFLWAVHSVHHQSEDFNLTIAFRQGVIATFVTYVFFTPLAFVGFPVRMFLAVHGASEIYQFFTHTQLAQRLGLLEWIFMTPRHHRVHHGRGPECIDKNFGGLSVLMDRALGTFAAVTDPPTFGTSRGINSWSPIWANLHPFADLLERSASAPRAIDALTVWFAPPERRFEWEQPVRARFGYDATARDDLAGYLLAQIVLSTLLMALVGCLSRELPRSLVIVFVAFIASTLVVVTAFFDRKPWALSFERLRLGIGIPVFAVAAHVLRSGLAGFATVTCAASLVMLLRATAVRGRLAARSTSVGTLRTAAATA